MRDRVLILLLLLLFEEKKKIEKNAYYILCKIKRPSHSIMRALSPFFAFTLLPFHSLLWSAVND